MHLIYNPTANHQRHQQPIVDLRKRTTRDTSLVWQETQYAGHAQELALEAARKGADTVVAIGGDGTIHEVINGLMGVPLAERPHLGILPIGSGNDFAMAAGVPNHLEDAWQRLQAGSARTIDVAHIRDEHARETYWNNTCGMGLDGHISLRASGYRRIHGFLMYLIATLITLVRDFQATPYRLTIDDQATTEGSMQMLTLGNGPREGGGFTTTPHSAIDDGILEFALVKPLSRLQALWLIPKVLRGTHITSRFVTMGSFRKLIIDFDHPVVIHTDGENFSNRKACHLEIKLHPAALKLWV